MFVSERNNVELKQEVNNTLAKEIVAFLNSENGSIFVGINKNREVLGIEENKIDDSMRFISDVITDQISPSCTEFVHQYVVLIEEKNIIRIDVNKGNKLYYVKKYGMSENGCFVRNGSTCKGLKPEEIQKRFIESLNIPEKDITTIVSTRKNLSFQILKNYLITNDIHINEETFDDNFHLRTPNGEYNYLAELLADKNDIVVNVAVFATEDKTQYLRREEFGGKCLILAMEQAKNYINSINQTFVDIKTTPRKEKKMFDTDAFEQAWINACVHNKWSESDHPGIYVYSNRLEIESFGGIPKSLTKEQFLKGKSEPVNKRLFDIFRQCHFAEESGHGVPSVVNVYGEEAYEFSDNFITVRIPFNKDGFSESKKTTSKTTKKHPEAIRKEILSLLKANPYLSRVDLAIAINVTEGSIRHHLNRLKESRIIVHKGSDKGGYWEVIKK